MQPQIVRILCVHLFQRHQGGYICGHALHYILSNSVCSFPCLPVYLWLARFTQQLHLACHLCCWKWTWTEYRWESTLDFKFEQPGFASSPVKPKQIAIRFVIWLPEVHIQYVAECKQKCIKSHLDFILIRNTWNNKCKWGLFSFFTNYILQIPCI